MSDPIKAVLWDFGGVITSSPFEAFNKFEVEKKIPVDFIRQINAENHETNAWANWRVARLILMSSIGYLGWSPQPRDMKYLGRGHKSFVGRNQARDGIRA